MGCGGLVSAVPSFKTYTMATKRITVKLIQSVEIFYEDPEQIEKAIALLKEHWACAMKGKNDVYGFEKKKLIDVVIPEEGTV